jgi:serine protease Do
MELHELDLELAALVGRVRRSLVQINVERRRGWSRGHAVAGSGAGTIWHPDGLIVTNAHVVQGRSVSITLPELSPGADGGSPLPARVLALDRNLDIAALAVAASGLPTIEPGESSKLRAGQWVMALGHPWGVHGAVTGGVVIGVGSEWHELSVNVRGGRRLPREWITASLQLRPGHSGGPMVDVDGRLVGINAMMTGPGVGVAVPVHVVKRFLHQALAASPVGTA